MKRGSCNWNDEGGGGLLWGRKIHFGVSHSSQDKMWGEQDGLYVIIRERRVRVEGLCWNSRYYGQHNKIKTRYEYLQQLRRGYLIHICSKPSSWQDANDLSLLASSWTWVYRSISSRQGKIQQARVVYTLFERKCSQVPCHFIHEPGHIFTWTKILGQVKLIFPFNRVNSIESKLHPRLVQQTLNLFFQLWYCRSLFAQLLLCFCEQLLVPLSATRVKRQLREP